MPQYILNASNFQPGMVGEQYHIGISDGSKQYGYVFQNRGGTDERSYFTESSDVTSKSSLIQYSSPNLIDRDLVFWPRVSQGDFSGGGLQIVFINPNQYMDSDLDTATPGYLHMSERWDRDQTNVGARNANYRQVVAFNGFLYFTFCESSGTIWRYDPKTATWISAILAGGSCIAVMTDGASLFVPQNNMIFYDSSNGALTSFTAIANSLNGTAFKWWIVSQGTNGRFVYYTVRSTNVLDTLYKIDLNATRPVAPGNQPIVLTGSQAMYIQDIVPYQNGIAILGTDATALNALDVWYHDGVNMTRIVRVEGYKGVGMCSCLGDLYIAAQNSLTFGGSSVSRTGPILAKISGGTFEVVARPGIPLATSNLQAVGQPQSSGEYVFWPVKVNATPLGLVNGSAAVPRVMYYNTLTGSSGFMPNLDNTDWGSPSDVLGDDLSSHRNLAVLGGSVAFTYVSASTGVVQFQDQIVQRSPVAYQASGWVVSSKHDFQTPGVTKRFRRIQLNHAPLNTGELLTIRAFVDLDPLKFTTSLAPNPASATVTNSTIGSTTTTLRFGADTVGHTLYYAVQLQSGTGNQTSPVIYYTAIEVGGTWNWEFDLDCTSRRRLTNGTSEDAQGITGKDLYYLLRNAYENGTPLTLMLANNVSYTANIETLKAQAPGYVDHPPVKADEEWLVHVVMRQEAA